MSTSEASALERRIGLVSGYHDVSFPPADAWEAGLRHRFSVVMDTARSDKADMYFDTQLFMRLIPGLCQVIGYDSVSICLQNKDHFPSFEKLAHQYARQDDSDQEPPPRIELLRSGQLVSIVETEFWTMVGGPSPYHDSYTFSFFTRENLSTELRHAAETICAEVGATIVGFQEVEQIKPPYRPLWKRVLNWIAGNHSLRQTQSGDPHAGGAASR